MAKIKDVPDEERLLQVNTYFAEFVERATKWIRRKPRARKDIYLTYQQLRLLEDQHEAFGKEITAALQAVTINKLVGQFEDAGEKSINTSLGFRLTLTRQSRVSMVKNPEDKPDGWQRARMHAWLIKNKMRSLIVPYVHPSTLSAEMQNWMAETNREPPKDIFNVFQQPIISMTKIDPK